MDLQSLYAQKRELAAAMAATIDKDELTDEDSAKFDDLDAQFAKVEANISKAERALEVARLAAADIDIKAGRTGQSADQIESGQEAYNNAYWLFMAHGMGALSGDQRELMAAKRQNTPMAAQSVGTDSAGGFLVPEDFRRQLEVAMLAFGGVRNLATVLRSNSGAKLPMPTSNDTGNEGAIFTENTQVTEQDVAFGAVELDAYMYSSKIIRVSLQLLQDSAFDLNGFLSAAMGERLGRITNRHFTVGTGTNQPNGVVTAATVGVTAAGVAAITHDELVDLEHSVDPSYRIGASWMWADSTFKLVKKLKDADGRPLWQPSLSSGDPNLFAGYPYEINQHMAAPATGNRTVTFGAHSKYTVRDVQDVQMMRLTERYADYLQVGFLGYSRHDGDLLDAGTNPVKCLVQA